MSRLRVQLTPDTGDVPSSMAAKRLGLTEAEFARLLSELIRDGFPAPHPITRNFCLEAIDAYRRGPHARLLGLTAGPTARDARSVDIRARVAGLR